MDRIVKVGLAYLRNGEILLVRKRGSKFLILPGGKPEMGETSIMALNRELDEELGCTLNIDTIDYLGTFSDIAAGTENVKVVVELYAGILVGSPVPQAEIESIDWVSLEASPIELAPSLRNLIFPFLLSRCTSDQSKEERL